MKIDAFIRKFKNDLGELKKSLVSTYINSDINIGRAMGGWPNAGSDGFADRNALGHTLYSLEKRRRFPNFRIGVVESRSDSRLDFAKCDNRGHTPVFYRPFW